MISLLHLLQQHQEYPRSYLLHNTYCTFSCNYHLVILDHVRVLIHMTPSGMVGIELFQF